MQYSWTGNQTYLLWIAILFLLLGVPAANAQSPDELFNQAMSLDKDGFLEESTEVWEKLLKANPEDKLKKPAQLKLASTLFKLLKIKKSEELVRDLIGSDANNYHAHFHLANILSAQRKFAEAIPEFQKVIELRPDEGLGFVGLALSHFGNREADISIQQVKSARAIFRKKKNIVWTQNMRIMTQQIKSFAIYPPSFADLWLENNLKLVQKTYEEKLFTPWLSR
jgi:tetratricopeptide (TPR) repeat protein